jgi:hypothetical protein
MDETGAKVVDNPEYLYSLVDSSRLFAWIF